jgi:hypothetical protein
MDWNKYMADLQIEREIGALLEFKDEMKKEFKEVKDLVNNLNSWRWKVIGFASGVSAATTYVITQLFK